MAEYIERDAVLKAFRLTAKNPDKRYEKGMQDTIDCLVPQVIADVPTADVQPVDKDSMHIVYIGRKAYLAENTIMEFMKKMDIIRDSLAHIENYFDTYAETIQQINACVGRCTDITEVKYFINRIKENCGYD